MSVDFFGPARIQQLGDHADDRDLRICRQGGSARTRGVLRSGDAGPSAEHVDVQQGVRAESMKAILLCAFATFAFGCGDGEPQSPSPSILPTAQPSPSAPADEWATYHEQMALFYRWKGTLDARLDTVEQRQGEMESRLDEHRRVLAFIPEILDRLGPEKITPEHHSKVQALAKQLHQATGKAFPTIYDELKTAFEKPRLEDLLEEDWPQIENWFQVQLERAKKKR